MRYFICPSEDLPRFCTVRDTGNACEIVWSVFDFAEHKNSILTRIHPMSSADGFISNILIRLQKFKEVDGSFHAAQYEQALCKSAALSRNGVTAKVETVYGPTRAELCP
jgi:hypothetical protein